MVQPSRCRWGHRGSLGRSGRHRLAPRSDLGPVSRLRRRRRDLQCHRPAPTQRVAPRHADGRESRRDRRSLRCRVAQPPRPDPNQGKPHARNLRGARLPSRRPSPDRPRGRMRCHHPHDPPTPQRRAPHRPPRGAPLPCRPPPPPMVHPHRRPMSQTHRLTGSPTRRQLPKGAGWVAAGAPTAVQPTESGSSCRVGVGMPGGP